MCKTLTITNKLSVRSKIEVPRDVRNSKGPYVDMTSSGKNGLNIRTYSSPNGTGPGIRMSKRPLFVTC